MDQSTQQTTNTGVTSGTGASQSGSGRVKAPTVFATHTPEEIAKLQSALTPQVAQKYPHIVELLFKTPSLSMKEKQYWLQLLSFMTDDQVEKLRSILENEKAKLLNLNKKYEEELQKVEMASPATPKKQAEQQKLLRKKEEFSEQEEKQKEEELLNELTQL